MSPAETDDEIPASEPNANRADRLPKREPEVSEIEAAFKLPAIIGTSKQVDWARCIRCDFFKCIRGKKITCRKDCTLAVQEFIRVSRTTTDCQFWFSARSFIIPQNGTSIVEYAAVAWMAQAKAAADKYETIIRDAAHGAESLRDNRDFKKFNAIYGLPPLVGRTDAQIRHANRCRYYVLRRLTPEQINEDIQAISAFGEGTTWIAAEVRGHSWSDIVAKLKHLQDVP